MRSSAVDLINIVLLLALFGFCIVAWPTLPERLPVHFGLDGAPDRWVDRTLWSWFAIPLLAAAVAVLLYGLGRLVPRRPALLNVPDKKGYLSLSPEHRAPVIDVMITSLRIASAIVLVMMIGIQIGLYRTALGDDGEGMVIASALVAVVGMPIGALVMVTRLQSRITAGLRAQRREEEG